MHRIKKVSLLSLAFLMFFQTLNVKANETIIEDSVYQIEKDTGESQDEIVDEETVKKLDENETNLNYEGNVSRVTSLQLNIDKADGMLLTGKEYTFSMTVIATPTYENISAAIPLFNDKYEDFTKFIEFMPNSDDWFTDADGNKFRYEITYLNGRPYLTLKIPKLFSDEDDWTVGEEFPIVMK